MVGFAGYILSPNAAPRPSHLRSMVGTLHELPDRSTGSIAFESLGLSLAIANDNVSGHHMEPVWNPERDLCLVFCGEHFGRNRTTKFPAFAAELLAQFRRTGIECLGELNGGFTGLIADIYNRQATLFTDRFGLGRLYYHHSNDGFYFATEAKALLAAFPALRNIDQRGIAELFSVGCVLQHRTLFPGICYLPGASAWIVNRAAQVTKRRYFDPATWEQQSVLSPEEYAARLKDTFAQIAPRYAVAETPVGISLTGGLDSRMVLAWVGAKPGSIPCYSFGSPYRECADVRLARKLAAASGQPHSTIPIGDDFFALFPKLAEKTVWQSDGTMDVSGAVELYVNGIARRIAPVRLTGNYGSEILRHNVAFRPRHVDLSLHPPEFATMVHEAAETYRGEAACHQLSFIAFKQVPWHHFARRSIERSQLIPRSPFLDNELVALAYRIPSELIGSPLPLLELIACGNPALERVMTDRAHHRHPTWSTRLIHAWQEFTAKAEYAYDYGMPGWLAQIDGRLSCLHLERLFLGRHKFYHFRIWYRDYLKDHLRTFEKQSAGSLAFYRPGVTAKIMDDHVSGRSNHTVELHRMLTVHLIESTLTRRKWAD